MSTPRTRSPSSPSVVESAWGIVTSSCPPARPSETSGAMSPKSSVGPWTTSATAREKPMFWYRIAALAIAAAALVFAAERNVNVPDADGTTPLAWAAYNDDLASVRHLIHDGADPKIANRYGITPLSLAATNRNAAI